MTAGSQSFLVCLTFPAAFLGRQDGNACCGDAPGNMPGTLSFRPRGVNSKEPLDKAPRPSSLRWVNTGPPLRSPLGCLAPATPVATSAA